MVVLELIGMFFRIMISFLFQMIGLFLSFLLGISTLVSRVWMLLLFATVCFHACGLDSGSINMFSDAFTLVAYNCNHSDRIVCTDDYRMVGRHVLLHI